jgi:hypothetical protein
MSPIRVASPLSLLFLLSTALSVFAQGKPERFVSDVNVGFGFGAGSTTTLKLGHWSPIAVQIAVRNGAFRGEIEITTPDSDGNEATIVIPNVAVEESVNQKSETFYGHVKFGKSDLKVQVRLIEVDANGKRTVVHEIERALAERGRAADIVQNGQELLVYYGDVGGVFEIKDLIKTAFLSRQPTTARLRSEKDFPTQWYGYGGVDYLLIGTGDEKLFDRLDPQRLSALRTWVRQGGRLVVSVGKNWQIVRDSVLGPMLPAKLVGIDEIDPSKTGMNVAFEHFADRKAPMEMRPGTKIQSVRLEKLHTPGKVSFQHAGRPLVYTAAYGLGQVTLVAFDVGEQPFRDWKGASRFWINLLKLRMPTDAEMNQQQNFGGYGGDYDESQEINNRMEDFPDVTVVPFHWVALLIFLYILLIGPVDYFFLKKVVKRLELTWITFPTWVVVVSAAAYYSAYLLKGDDLRLNRLELVDVDQTSNTLRGTSFLCVFSPRIDRYSVAYTPDLGSDGSWSQLAANANDATDLKAGTMGEDQTVGVASWHGVPDETQRGFGGESTGGILGKRPYRFQVVDNGANLRVQEAPVQVWSVKTFTSQWLGRSQPVVESNLRVEGLQLRGTIKNLLPHPMEGVVLAFGDLVWMIPKLEPNLVVDVAAVQSRSLSDMLRNTGGVDQNFNRWQRQRSLTGSFADTDNLMRVLLFHRARGDVAGGARREAGSFYLSNLDFSRQLEFGRAVLLARLPMNVAPAGKLWLNDLPNDKTEPRDPGAKQRTQTYIRALIDPAKENK